MNQTRAVAVALGAALAACAGPRWTVAPPADAAVYVDGRRETRTSMPLRYYGTTAVDAVPVVPERAPAGFDRVPTRTLTAHDEPASPWLFPLDFPLECLERLFGGTPPLELAAVLRPQPPLVTGFAPTELEQIRARAFAARTSR